MQQWKVREWLDCLRSDVLRTQRSVELKSAEAKELNSLREGQPLMRQFLLKILTLMISQLFSSGKR